MNAPSPAEARDALARARAARRSTADSLRTPWWLWATLGVVLALYIASRDYGSSAQMAGSIGLGVLAVAWVVAGRLSPRVGAASGNLHRSALPQYAWLPVVLICIVFGVIQYLADPAVHHMLTGSGMPAWIREHPYSTQALPYAAAYIAVGLLMSAAVRQMARHAAVR